MTKRRKAVALLATAMEGEVPFGPLYDQTPLALPKLLKTASVARMVVPKEGSNSVDLT